MPELVLTAEFEIDGYLRRLEVFGDACADLKEPLARCGGYLRGQAKHRIDAGGPGWQDLAPETVRRKMTTARLQLLEALFPRRRPGKMPVQRAAERLATALNRGRDAKTTRARVAAKKRAAHEGETLALYQRAFGVPAGVRDINSLIAFAEREQRRIRLHGEALRAARHLPAGSDARARVGRIGKPRYQRSERSTQLLGGLYDSIHLRVEAKLVVVFSGPSWSGVHNKGGQAGHGARIPERRYLKIEARDVQVFVGIFRAYLLDGFVS